MFKLGWANDSTDVRKFKQWQDAEYTVTGVDISRQRLAVDGVFGVPDAVAAVHIDHKGHQVAVGSGLTAEQRIRWAKDPKSIVSTVTFSLAGTV